MRYKLEELFDDASELTTYITGGVTTAMTMGLTTSNLSELLAFVGNVIFGYFFEDLVAYDGEDDGEVQVKFIIRICYDINLHLPYWYRKYNQVKKLLTDADFSMLQTSKVISSSSDKTKSASGTLQKTATTPTGVSADSATDSFDIQISESEGVTTGEVDTTGFADKYTNAQQKFANAGRVEGERSGLIEREGSVKDLIEILEKLPASFGNEISITLQKHFIFDYEGEERGYYNETL